MFKGDGYILPHLKRFPHAGYPTIAGRRGISMSFSGTFETSRPGYASRPFSISVFLDLIRDFVSERQGIANLATGWSSFLAGGL